MIVKALIHSDDAGGYWAEVPSLPGCFAEGETLDALKANIRQAVGAGLGAGEPTTTPAGSTGILEVAV